MCNICYYDYKKAKDLNKVAKAANRILNIILKIPVELTIRENIFSRRVFIIIPEIPNFFALNHGEQRPWEETCSFSWKLLLNWEVFPFLSLTYLNENKLLHLLM